MALEAYFIKADDIQTFATTPARTAGEVVQFDAARAGVCVRDIAASTSGECYVEGVVRAAKTASLAVVKGQSIYWNDSTNKADVTGTFYMGVAAAASATTDTTVDVELNAPQSLGSSPLLLYVAVSNAEAVAGTVKYLSNAALPGKYRVVDAWILCANGTAGTVKFTDGTNDITNAITHGTTDNALVRASTIDDAYNILSAGATLAVTPATGGASVAYAMLMPVV